MTSHEFVRNSDHKNICVSLKQSRNSKRAETASILKNLTNPKRKKYCKILAENLLFIPSELSNFPTGYI